MPKCIKLSLLVMQKKEQVHQENKGHILAYLGSLERAKELKNIETACLLGDRYTISQSQSHLPKTIFGFAYYFLQVLDHTYYVINALRSQWVTNYHMIWKVIDNLSTGSRKHPILLFYLPMSNTDSHGINIMWCTYSNMYSFVFTGLMSTAFF